jgi:hypothetical protein
MRLKTQPKVWISENRERILMMKYAPKDTKKTASPFAVQAIRGFARDMGLEEAAELTRSKPGAVKTLWDAVGLSEYLPITPEVLMAIQAKAWGLPNKEAVEYVGLPEDRLLPIWRELNIKDYSYVKPAKRKGGFPEIPPQSKGCIRAMPSVVDAIIGNARGLTARQTARKGRISREYVNQIWKNLHLKPHTVVERGKHTDLKITPEVIRVIQAETLRVPRRTGIEYAGVPGDQYDSIVAAVNLKPFEGEIRTRDLFELTEYYKPVPTTRRATPRVVKAIQVHAAGYNPTEASPLINAAISTVSLMYNQLGLQLHPRATNPRTILHTTASGIEIPKASSPKKNRTYLRRDGKIPQRWLDQRAVFMTQGYAARMGLEETAEYADVSRSLVSYFWIETNMRTIPLPEGSPLSPHILKTLYEPSTTPMRATRTVLQAIIGHAYALSPETIETFYKREPGSLGVIMDLIGLKANTA